LTEPKAIIRYLRTLAERQGAAEVADAELLERFVAHGDPAAFELLVWRHERLVLGVCRRVLRDAQDAEDAFQATFLALVQKARSIGKRQAVASWLYKVAYRAALRARAQAARRGAREKQGVGYPSTAARPEAASEVLWQEILPRLDRELDRLPEKYRAPVVLCYLQGKTYEDAARQLGCPKGTVSIRLTRARELLRRRLAGGLALPAGVFTAALARPADGAPAPLVTATVTAAVRVLAGSATAGVVPANVATLTQGVLKAMLLSKLRLTGLFWLAAALFAAGLGVFAGQGRAVGDREAPGRGGSRPATQAGAGKEPAPQAGQKSLDRAVQAAAEIKDLEQKALTLALVAEAQTRAGDRKAALQTLRRAFKTADALPNEDDKNFYVRCVVLGQIVGATAEAGDVDAARKTIEAMMRKPRVEKVEGVYELDPEFVENTRAMAHMRIAVAQAKAGKHQEAAEIVGRLDDKRRRWFGGEALAEVAVAQARAGDWKHARQTAKAIDNETFQIIALLGLARLHAKAGKGEQARARIAEALAAVPRDLPEDDVVQEGRANHLLRIARAQAEVEDVKAALVTAETIPELKPLESALVKARFPYRQLTLAELHARAGDFKAARKAARAIADERVWQKGYAFRLIARAQAEAKDAKGALETADAIEHAFHKAAAYAEVARAQARAGDRAGSARTFAKALGAAEEVPETPDRGDLDRASTRPSLLRALATAQAEVGEEKAAGEWIARQSSPCLRAWSLIGLAEGAAKRRAAAKPPR
jgi:RNA polymerase sigma factor (sigma-70 family)